MGYKVKEVRQQKKMSQEELSKASGVSRSIISGLENNTTRTTSVKTLLKLASALGVTVDAIFYD